MKYREMNAEKQLDRIARQRLCEEGDRKTWKDFTDRLLLITKGCRPDMHEPDEQGLEANISGDHLDNAMGDEPGQGEFVITLVRDRSEEDEKVESFNLSNLIACARRGATALRLLEKLGVDAPKIDPDEVQL